tara:strand:- start:3394 stop:5130 length:1737 start_codon:yes stop_codon:yes gene_type:complete
MQKAEFELVAKTGKAEANVKKVDEAVKKTGKSVRKAKKELSGMQQVGNAAVGQLDKMTGGLASKLVAVAKAAKLSGKAMKTALISSGIGLAVVALALIVEYWDEISSLVDGVSGEQAKALQATQDTLAAQEQQLDTISKSENILKLQGKTEAEILAMKRQITDESIATTKILLEQQKQTKKSQLEAAERNQKIAAGIIAFLSMPITILLGAVDALTYGLEKVGLIDEATSLVKDAAMATASLLFDPEQVATEGDEAIQATEEALLKLENTRAGYLVKDKEAAKKNADDKKNDEIEAEKAKAAALERIRKGLIDTEAEERLEKLRLIKEDYAQQIKLAEEYYGLESEKVKELRAAQEAARLEQQAEFDLQDKDRKDKKTKDEEDALALRNKTIADDLAEQARIDKEAKEFKEKEYQEGYANLQTIVSAGGKKLEKVGKALAIADIARSSFKSISETVSSTGAANAKAVSASPTTAGMPFVAINTVKAALSIGATLASAKKSISAITSNSKNPSGSSPSAGGGGGGAQPPAFNVVGASGADQLADAIGGQSQRPSRAYVVSNDVTTAQELDRNIIEGSSI